MRVAGYSDATIAKHVVVSGERVISFGEVVPIPEGTAILVLHDPPGGESFSVFENVHATTVITVNGGETENLFEFELNQALGADTGTTVSALGPEVEVLDMQLLVGLYQSSQFGDWNADEWECMGNCKHGGLGRFGEGNELDHTGTVEVRSVHTGCEALCNGW